LFSCRACFKPNRRSGGWTAHGRFLPATRVCKSPTFAGRGGRRNSAEIIAAKLAERRDTIDGVWCDSGLQGVGSLRAYVEAGRSGAIPPHTGGDLNLAYKLAIRHGVSQAAVDYPPAMGLRAVEALLDVLRGRPVPRRIDVPTEIVVTRGHATRSVRPDLWSDEHVRWDLPDDLILASGLGASYDPRSFRVHYKGNRYNRSAAHNAGAPNARR
jgi:ribose transport system substrate-binding protein